MRITERLLAFTLLGSEWVLWLLVCLSVLSVAGVVVQANTLRAQVPDLDALAAKLLPLLGKGDAAAAKAALGEPRSPEARVGLVGIGELGRGRNAVLEAMASARARERLQMERNLGVLGTLGN